jgi:hypothetical protein
MGFKPRTHAALIQDWDEFERGWGSRPDGYTLHLSVEDHAEFVKGFYAGRGGAGKAVPDEYSAVSGSARAIEVNSRIWRRLKKQRAEPEPMSEWHRYGVWGGGNRLQVDPAEPDADIR